MADALRWEDDTGRTRWQPCLSNGQLLWYDPWGGPMWSTDRPVSGYAEIYRCRWWARWKAHREERRRTRLFRPVENYDV